VYSKCLVLSYALFLKYLRLVFGITVFYREVDESLATCSASAIHSNRSSFAIVEYISYHLARLFFRLKLFWPRGINDDQERIVSGVSQS
jgi:hypothetical protein